MSESKTAGVVVAGSLAAALAPFQKDVANLNDLQSLQQGLEAVNALGTEYRNRLRALVEQGQKALNETVEAAVEEPVRVNRKYTRREGNGAEKGAKAGKGVRKSSGRPRGYVTETVLKAIQKLGPSVQINKLSEYLGRDSNGGLTTGEIQGALQALKKDGKHGARVTYKEGAKKGESTYTATV